MSNTEYSSRIIGTYPLGSGYGGGIAASRAARAGMSVCVLERGKEWSPGDFKESITAVTEIQVKERGKDHIGKKYFNLIRGNSEILTFSAYEI